MVVVNGREIDNSCPYSSDCFGNGGCFMGSCPETLYDVLQRSAEMEHELGLVPHTDPDLAAVCTRAQCKWATADAQR